MIKSILKHLIVERNDNIKEQYLEFLKTNDVTGIKGGLKKVFKLLSLNLESESRKSVHEGKTFSMSLDELLEILNGYDVISFDIFDTLIFRRIKLPVDLFTYMEAKYHFPGFSEIRIQAEKLARNSSANSEVTIYDIYKALSKESIIDINLWIKREIETEKEMCFANPFMLEAFEKLKQKGKLIIATSDMYYGRDVLQQILYAVGYKDLNDIYVSCEYAKSKWNGGLFSVIHNKYPDKSIIHMGDNFTADYIQARNTGCAAIYYPNVSSIKRRQGLNEMSALTRSIYESLLNTHLYCGKDTYNDFYKFGYEYGGIIACGYCQWIYQRVKEKQIDKLLFVARDGYILKKIFDKYYPEVSSEYIPFSRYNAQQILFERSVQKYFEQVIIPRCSSHKKLSVGKVLNEVDLDLLSAHLGEVQLNKEDIFDAQAVKKIKVLIYQYRADILDYFSKTQNATYQYLEPIIKDCANIMVVDVGWNGTCGIAIKYLLEQKKYLALSIYSALIGTREGQEPLTRIANGDLEVYSFSSNHNLDVLKKHIEGDVNYHNLLIESLFTSPEASFLKYSYDDKGNIVLVYSQKEKRDDRIIYQIHKGILDFVDRWIENSRKLTGVELRIDGRDAILPLQAWWRNCKDGKTILNTLDIHVFAGKNDNG